MFQLRANHVWSFVSYERPTLDDEAKPHSVAKIRIILHAAVFYHRGLAMTNYHCSQLIDTFKQQCQVWSPVITNSASFNMANCKTHLKMISRKTTCWFSDWDVNLRINLNSIRYIIHFPRVYWQLCYIKRLDCI